MRTLLPGSAGALVVEGLSKSFVGQRVLTELNLQIGPGEVHALLGQNGSGKSTFIKILSGYHAPDSGGTVWIDGQSLLFCSPEASAQLGMRFVHQDLGLIDALSIADNMSFGSRYPLTLGTIRSKQVRSEVRRDLAFAGLDLDPDQPVGDLVPALKAGVAIARALKESKNSTIKLLVLDEATATLPFREVEHFLNTVKTVAERGVAVLYVSHHLNETFAIADTVTVLRDGHVVHNSSVADLTHDSLVQVLVGHEVTPGRAFPIAAGEGVCNQGAVLDVTGLRSGVVNGVDVSVRAGEIVGVAGITGSGRESLLPAIFGATPRQQGVVRVGSQEIPGSRPDLTIRAGATYLPSNRARHSAFMGLSARENLTVSDVRRFWKFPRLRLSQERAEVQGWFESLNIRPGGGYEMPLSIFSGGNQQKVILARFLRCHGKVLLLENPTEGVDVGAKAEIHKQVVAAAASGMAVIISSIDAEELSLLCHRVLVMHRGLIGETLAEHPDEPSITAAALGQESVPA